MGSMHCITCPGAPAVGIAGTSQDYYIYWALVKLGALVPNFDKFAENFGVRHG